jgi:hypothetical protein
VSDKPSFDPYALLEALNRNRVSYVLVGAFARVVHGSRERTRGLDVVPSLREENQRRLARALAELGVDQAAARLSTGEPTAFETSVGLVNVVPAPWGTRGYDDLRIRVVRENLGRGVRAPVASALDLARMLEASSRTEDHERLTRFRRLIELERQLTRRRGLGIER